MAETQKGRQTAHLGGGLGTLLGTLGKTFLLDPHLAKKKGERELAHAKALGEQEAGFAEAKEEREAGREATTLQREEEGLAEVLGSVGYKFPEKPAMDIGEGAGVRPAAKPRVPKELAKTMLESALEAKTAKPTGPKNIWEAAAQALPKGTAQERTDWVSREQAEAGQEKKALELHEKGERPLMESASQKAQEELQFSGDVVDSLTRMQQYYQAGASEGVGPIRGGEKLSYAMRVVGMGAPHEAEFRAEAGELTSRVVKMFSGAQSSDPERRHIAATLPQGNEASLADYEAKHHRSLSAAKYIRARKLAYYAMSQNEINKHMKAGTLDKYLVKAAGGRPDWLRAKMKEDAARKIGETMVAPNGRSLVWDGRGWVAVRDQ